MKIINVLKVKCFHTSSLYHTESEYYTCLKKKDIVKHNIYMYVNHKTMKDQIRNSSIYFNPDNMQLPDGASSIITL